MKVLVTGATGKSGSVAINEMIKMGVSIRALVHSADERSDKLAAQGIEVMVGDLLNFDDISAAMKDIHSAYFCFPILTPGVLQATAYFAQAAKDAGVKAIVNMSQVSARRDAKSNAAQDHWVGERILDMTGIPTTHLRPTFFDEWFLYIREDVQKKDTIVLPFGNGRWAPIDSADLGRVVARILTNPKEYEGKTFKLYGPEEYNVPEMSEILSEVLSRKIKYDPVSIEHFTESDAEKGAHSHFIQHVTHVAQDCIDGLFAGTNDSVETITGRKPTTLAEFFAKNKALFQ
ncbi:Uncharacterized conserved protein YbjT, contains NAD(P)-binding and DUF2867 domains [Chitinophaga sp. YR573]|uniref:NmrA family NAD(P)-binding protein n=1 Tax=Chitinophaga sp. YR573 TaxID=1881040 RepID=UPI0008B8CEBA|nr:NmrA family NAD(P)-binding protein [Chitinophaga sp. YR573]SEW27786.1 Uncharacterized conserved protein YbjT, contains NAD(P)-binding and DUF2867 domains [Chitinophaga sp. YR573]